MYRLITRGIDLLVSVVVLLLALPLLCGLAVAIGWTMGRPVLFSQPRPGLHARVFRLYKFRTMRPPRSGEDAAATDAQRMTRLGRWLRSTSLDELPTLWNVLRGDMSLVGPRPLLVQYLPRYTPEQARRHEAKPGITGWAQVNGRNALSWEDKFRLDVWYVEHRSVLLDLRIVLMTIGKVLRREGISHGGEATMPEFTGSSTESVSSRRDPTDV